MCVYVCMGACVCVCECVCVCVCVVLIEHTGSIIDMATLSAAVAVFRDRISARWGRHLHIATHTSLHITKIPSSVSLSLPPSPSLPFPLPPSFSRSR